MDIFLYPGKIKQWRLSGDPARSSDIDAPGDDLSQGQYVVETNKSPPINLPLCSTVPFHNLFQFWGMLQWYTGCVIRLWEGIGLNQTDISSKSTMQLTKMIFSDSAIFIEKKTVENRCGQKVNCCGQKKIHAGLVPLAASCRAVLRASTLCCSAVHHTSALEGCKKSGCYHMWNAL